MFNRWKNSDTSKAYVSKPFTEYRDISFMVLLDNTINVTVYNIPECILKAFYNTEERLTICTDSAYITLALSENSIQVTSSREYYGIRIYGIKYGIIWQY